MVSLNQNLLEGRIPQRLLGGSEQAQKVVSAKALECPTCEQVVEHLGWNPRWHAVYRRTRRFEPSSDAWIGWCQN
eukprot:6218615-Amphidinium_carterae.1